MRTVPTVIQTQMEPGKAHETQSDTKNCRQLRTREQEKKNLLWERAQQLHIQYQIVSPEGSPANIHRQITL